MGGYADFLVPSAYASGHGAITGLANLFPVSSAFSSAYKALIWMFYMQNAIDHLFRLSEASRKDPSLLTETQRLQGIIARADFTIAKASITGTKYLLEKLYGYGGVPRKPLPAIDSAAAQALWEHPDTQAAIKLEHESLQSGHASLKSLGRPPKVDIPWRDHADSSATANVDLPVGIVPVRV